MKAFEKRIYLSSPTMHGEEMEYIRQAYATNWMSTVGENIDAVEHMTESYVGCQYAVGVSCGTAALHLAVKLAGVQTGDTVFCSDMTFAATVNPVVYERGVPIFIDSERDTWNMDPAALERAFALYPKTKVVIVADLYGTPAKLDEIRQICGAHGATLIEDAAESLGAVYQGRKCGTFGTYNVLSFNGNKIITGSAGGMLLTDDKAAADRARKWSAQSRENVPWYQHEEIGYNYRMSNVIAGIVRGQFPHLPEHIARKQAIYQRYKDGFRDLPVTMNPYDPDKAQPNFWLSCLLIHEEAMGTQIRHDPDAAYRKEKGKSSPCEILETLSKYNAEGRPIWKPMHMQPVFRGSDFIRVCRAADGVSGDIFRRGLCLPSDIKMTVQEQDAIIEMVRSCFA